MKNTLTENRRCCGCSDDEAYKYSECFCLCHTRDHQRIKDDERAAYLANYDMGLS